MTRVLALASLLCLTVVPTVFAGDAATDDGLCKGDSIGAFYVTKVGGAEGDGVEVGESLCYRCRYGGRPMVMVFARKAGSNVEKFVKDLDQAVGEASDADLKGLVTMLGAESETLEKEAKTLTSHTGVKNVPVVVSKDPENGPGSYKLNPTAEITVVIADRSQVVAKHEFSADSIDTAAVMSDVKSVLN